MAVQESNNSIEEIEESYERQFQPLLHFKEPLDLQKLVDGGDSFEFNDDNIQHERERPTVETRYNVKDVYNHTSAVTLNGLGDDENVDPFESLSKKMTDLTGDGGVMKQLLQQGVGDQVPKGSTVYIHYSLYLEHCDEPFDCTRLRGQVQKHVLRTENGTECDTILGLDISVASMRKAENARFLIKPEYAFGPLGAPPRIPPDSTIMAEVELLNFMRTGDAQAYMHLPISERKEVPFDMCLQAVVDLRIQGNDLYKQKQYRQACFKYEKAIRLLQDARLADDKDENLQRKELLTIATNCALAHTKLEEWKRAITFCNQALHIDENHAKGCYLKGQACMNLNDLSKARHFLLKARDLQKSDSSISKLLKELDRRQQQCNKDYQAFCSRMFGLNVSKTKDDSKDTEADGIGPEFETTLRNAFNGMSPGDSLPFTRTSMTSTELECIRTVAQEMNFIVEERGKDMDYHLKVIKKDS